MECIRNFPDFLLREFLEYVDLVEEILVGDLFNHLLLNNNGLVGVPVEYPERSIDFRADTDLSGLFVEEG